MKIKIYTTEDRTKTQTIVSKEKARKIYDFGAARVQTWSIFHCAVGEQLRAI